jgi:hypothetical protein
MLVACRQANLSGLRGLSFNLASVKTKKSAAKRRTWRHYRRLGSPLEGGEGVTTSYRLRGKVDGRKIWIASDIRSAFPLAV